jgi:LemA protein
MWIAISIIAVVVVLGLVVMSTYNSLVTKLNRYKNAFAQIDVQLKRRYDLIPNLVEVAKKYMAHERDTLEAVIKARNAAHTAAETAAKNPGDPNAMKELASADGALTAGLSKIMVLSESYPELKANTTMHDLSEELTSTENKVAFARQASHDSVADYNTTREVFPAVLFAGTFGFSEAALLESIEHAEERAAPKVSFS